MTVALQTVLDAALTYEALRCAGRCADPCATGPCPCTARLMVVNVLCGCNSAVTSEVLATARQIRKVQLLLQEIVP